MKNKISKKKDYKNLNENKKKGKYKKYILLSIIIIFSLILLLLLCILWECFKVLNIIKEEGLLLDSGKSIDNLKKINIRILSLLPKFILEWYGLMAAIIAGSLLNHLKNNSSAELKIIDPFLYNCSDKLYISICKNDELIKKFHDYIEKNKENQKILIIPIIIQKCEEKKCEVGNSDNNIDKYIKYTGKDVYKKGHVTIIEIKEKDIIHFDPNEERFDDFNKFEEYFFNKLKDKYSYNLISKDTDDCSKFDQTKNTCTFLSAAYVFYRILGIESQKICKVLDNNEKSFVKFVKPIISMVKNNETINEENIKKYHFLNKLFGEMKSI